MPVQVENLTDWPTREVERLVRWACRELDVTSPALLVRVRRGKWIRGRYYPTVHGRGASFYSWDGYKDVSVKVPPGVSHLITIGLPTQWPRAATYYNRVDVPPPDTYQSWQEGLIAVTAHEARHHWQYVNRQKRRSGRRRWQFREDECDWAGYRILKRWRESRKKKAA